MVKDSKKLQLDNSAMRGVGRGQQAKRDQQEDQHQDQPTEALWSAVGVTLAEYDAIQGGYELVIEGGDNWAILTKEELRELKDVLLEQQQADTKDMDALQRDLGQWSDATFGAGQRRGGMIVHLAKEYKEFLGGVFRHDDLALVAEAVDMVLLLMDIVRVSGYSLHGEMRKKLEILKTRRWQPMAMDGSVEYVRD